MRSLFLTYDGLLSPLGQSQILPYLRGLQARGHTIHILSFEHDEAAEPANQAALRQELTAQGIHWTARKYHKRPSVPATAYDILMGMLTARRLVRQYGIEVLHARSYVPMLMALLADQGQKLIFDMRGFWADERVDGHIWPQTSPIKRTLYRLAKALERWALRRADRVVVLTHAAKRVMPDIPGVQLPLPPIDVIPTCADLDRFQPVVDKIALRQELGLPADRRILVYQGSIGTWYMLPEMVAFVRQAKDRWPDLLWLVLSPKEHDRIRAACTAAALSEGVDYRIEALPHREMPRWVAAGDAALFFIKPSYSKLSSCPTKFGECLACGLPVVANTGVGDVGETLATHRVGPAVSAFSPADYERALDELESFWADPQTPHRCRQAAEADFALAEARERYDRLYRLLAETGLPAAGVNG
jgi:glycosyltransferase involved in cell wall biosynthesis